MKNPTGGADIRQIYWWTCDITNEIGKYYANLESESKTDNEYSVIEYNDIEKNGVMIYPDTPGMYKIKIIVEYLLKNKIQTKKSDSMKFIYDPNHELKYVTKEMSQRLVFRCGESDLSLQIRNYLSG